ncbi:hypothetical protein JSE7799_01401 [Jannaschia seosinensis]|uniref:Uncharacterized protein n=1 Tax=Jannaschia seosinensis TaxID=313367 RepID=A0A0M7BA45_9RHOB|nr:hypothetical protein [Jannaschia seosinensis]CUH38364.1 hypothetical protein JSE7799_01401 [Jannaschia seosinensis]
MRDFFIKALDNLVGIIVILGAVGIVISAGAALLAPNGGGVLMALAILIGGSINLILLGGFMYLGLGIYHNTRRMADAMDRDAAPR